MKYIGIVFVIILLMMTGVVRADEIDDIVPYVIQCESGGDPNAVSNAGCIGLMQINPNGALKEYNIEVQRYCKRNGLYKPEMLIGDLYKPNNNIKIGTWYLRRLKEYYLKDVNGFIKERDLTHYQAYVIECSPLSTASNTGRIGNKMYMYININGKEINTAEEYKLALVLSAYNGGITRLRKNNYDINKMPRETRNYVRRVMKLYREGL